MGVIQLACPATKEKGKYFAPNKNIGQCVKGTSEQRETPNANYS